MDKERILNKLAQLEQSLDELIHIIPDSKDIYLKSVLHRRAVERMLHISIENVIDICAILINEFKLGPPSNEENIFDLLKEKLPNIEILKEMKGFRNILVHRYSKIDDLIVYRNASERITDFEEFIACVKKLI